MKYIFLDVDGVLNSETYLITAARNKTFHDQVNEENVKHLAHIFNDDPENTKIILSSSWRHMRPTDERYKILVEKLAKYGMVISDKTGAFDYFYYNLAINCEWTRDLEILDYVNRHFHIDDTFVVLDDENVDTYKLLKYHFVRTTFETGLTKNQVNLAIRILKGEKTND